MTNTTETKVVYLTGASGRIVCTRSTSCAGITLMSSYTKHPNAAAWRGLNGEPYSVLDDATRELIASLTGSREICDCGGAL